MASTPSRCRIPLGQSLYLVASEFLGEVKIHIRHYERERPTKNGICLSLRRWNELKLVLREIIDTVAKYEQEKADLKHHLGGNWHVSVTQGFPCVDIRKFWLPDGDSAIRATRKGIALKFTEFQKLVEAVPVLDQHVPELLQVNPCYKQDDHQNQLGMLGCVECNPNSFSLF